MSEDKKSKTLTAQLAFAQVVVSGLALSEAEKRKFIGYLASYVDESRPPARGFTQVPVDLWDRAVELIERGGELRADLSEDRRGLLEEIRQRGERLSRTDMVNVELVRTIMQEHDDNKGTYEELCVLHKIKHDTFKTYRRRYKNQGLI